MDLQKKNQNLYLFLAAKSPIRAYFHYWRSEEKIFHWTNILKVRQLEKVLAS